MNYFPIFLDAKFINVLVVGGGEIATSKVELLLKSPAKVTLVSPKVSDSIQRLIDSNQISYINGEYQKSYLSGKQLVFVATANRSLNEQINQDATEQGVLANVVDNADLCHFITPAIIDRTPMIFAMSSSGQSPVLLRSWRAKLETMIPQSLGKLASFAGQKRQQVKDRFTTFSNRRQFWERFFNRTGIEQGDNLEQFFTEQLNMATDNTKLQAELLVVCTPKDPDLLSLGALRNMQKADSILVGVGVDANIVDLCRRDAPKADSNATTNNEAIDLLMQGARVCLLYNGDNPSDHPLLIAAKQLDCQVFQFNSVIA